MKGKFPMPVLLALYPQKQIKDSEEQQGSKDDTKDKLQSTT